MKSNKTGLYVHIPFCIKKCKYCDFCSFPDKTEKDRAPYIDALVREILSYKDKNIELDTVFFGGGTPSVLTPFEFEKIVKAIKETFALKADCEFTLEANPGTVSLEKLVVYKNAGVNRISLGLQSIHENEQKILGRIHNYNDFENSFLMCRSLGFSNINVDLMYAIPEQTKESFKKSVERVLSLQPDHISAYSLILEEGTPLYENKDMLNLVDEAAEREMYEELCSVLSKNGYSHYEISNYAKPGYESKHNLIYWQMDSYIGVGLSAHSYIFGERFCNTNSLNEYLAGGTKVREEGRTMADEAYEFAMLALRTKFGFLLKEYKDRFLQDFLLGRKEKIDRYTALGLMKCENGKIFLTESGFYVSNAILSDLL